MKLVVISPEADRSNEVEIVAQLFAAGLERFHVRKPQASLAQLTAYIEAIPTEWRSRLVLHQHHELVERYALGGRHWRDEQSADVISSVRHSGRETKPSFTSRSCHDLTSLRASLGKTDSVFFGPVFDSISKPGYGPKGGRVGEAVGAILCTRTDAERCTAVLALGGVNVVTASRVVALGFDGVAVLGAVWQAPEPVAAYRELADLCRRVGFVRTALLGRRFRSAAGRISSARC